MQATFDRTWPENEKNGDLRCRNARNTVRMQGLEGTRIRGHSDGARAAKVCSTHQGTSRFELTARGT